MGLFMSSAYCVYMVVRTVREEIGRRQGRERPGRDDSDVLAALPACGKITSAPAASSELGSSGWSTHSNDHHRSHLVYQGLSWPLMLILGSIDSQGYTLKLSRQAQQLHNPWVICRELPKSTPAPNFTTTVRRI